jgi:hypothetical protein
MHLFIYKILNKNQNARFEIFLHEFGRMWVTEKHTAIEFNSDNAQPQVTESMPQQPEQNNPSRLSRDFNKHKLEKTVAAGQGNKKYLIRQCRACAAHKKSLK